MWILSLWIIPATIACAVVAGLVIGLIVGKNQVKRSRPGYKPLLSRKEKIIYTALFLGGTALIMLGAFVKFPSPGASANDMLTFDQPPTEVVETV